MMKFLRHIFSAGWYFELLYLGVAIATFEHTAWSFGTMFLGEPVAEYFTLADPVWLRGGLVALAVDIGMFLVARAAVQEGENPHKNTMAIVGLYATFLIIGFISFFSQIIFAVYHTPDLVIAAGVSEYWVQFLTPIIEAAPFIMAGALPFMAVIFTISRAAMTSNDRTVKAKMVEEATLELEVDGESKIYSTVAGLRKALTRYKNSGKRVQIPESTQLQLEAAN